MNQSSSETFPENSDFLTRALHHIEQPLVVVNEAGRAVVRTDLDPRIHPIPNLMGIIPGVPMNSLGDAAFRREHGLEYSYVSGAMAAGIGSEAIAESMAAQGMLGVFGSAGLSLDRVGQAVDRLQTSTCGRSFGINLIHSPNEQDLESALVDLYLQKRVRLVEASAFLGLTPHIVRYRLSGVHLDSQGAVVAPNKVIAKVSRVEVAQKFMSPPPEKLVGELVASGQLTAEEGRLSQRIPMAQDITAEADSGGHTDNRPFVTLLPTIIALRDRLQQQYQYAQPLRVGAAGGISTPASTMAAYSLGAAYVLVGSVHQACVESGSSDVVRQMLAEAEQADTMMCPCADMFEMGVKVQVLKRGTMFAMRAGKLYELYRNYNSLEEIPAAERTSLENTILKASVTEVWRQTREFFLKRDPRQVTRAEADAKHLMALVFRWYLGQSSRWANAGLPDRRMDYQIWCGPAMGAFNEWTKGTFLAQPEERRVAQVAYNLLHGAAVLRRSQWLEQLGVPLSTIQKQVRPRRFTIPTGRMDVSPSIARP